MSASSFEHAVLPGRGRALVALRAIRPGEEVLREKPAAMVYNTDNNVEDCHSMLARILIASTTEEYRQPIADLVCMKDRFLAADPDMMNQLARTGTSAVRSLIQASHGKEAASCVTADDVESVFCKHALNSMTILTPESCSREVGMALYPCNGALMNHADVPNCWTMFEQANGESYDLIVRCIAPISAGEEITISYLDSAQTRSEIHRQLEAQYFIPVPPSGTPSHGGSSLPEAHADELQRIAERPLYASYTSSRAEDTPKEAAALLPRVTSVILVHGCVRVGKQNPATSSAKGADRAAHLGL